MGGPGKNFVGPNSKRREKIEAIHSQINRETPLRPTLDQPEVAEALRHGNIYEVLRAPGVNRHDIEEYLAGQSRLFQNQILQDYQVYAGEASIAPPDLETHFAAQMTDMNLDSGDRQLFKQEGDQWVRAQGIVYRASEHGEPEGPGRDVAGIGEKAIQEWDAFFSELQSKVVDAQMYRELASKSSDLKREVERILALVMSGQIDPEYVIIAATKANMMPNGVFFTGSAKKIMMMNEDMNKISKEIYKIDPVADPNRYMKESQMAQSKTRSASTNLQMEMMNLQKFAQNIGTTLEWASNAVRMMQEMRRTTTQAIAAR